MLLVKLSVLRSYVAGNKKGNIHQRVSGKLSGNTVEWLGSRRKQRLTAQPLCQCPTCLCCHHHQSRWSCWIPAHCSSWSKSCHSQEGAHGAGPVLDGHWSEGLENKTNGVLPGKEEEQGRGRPVRNTTLTLTAPDNSVGWFSCWNQALCRPWFHSAAGKPTALAGCVPACLPFSFVCGSVHGQIINRSRKM